MRRPSRRSGEEYKAAFLERLLQHLDGAKKGRKTAAALATRKMLTTAQMDPGYPHDLLGLIGPGEVGDEREEAFDRRRRCAVQFIKQWNSRAAACCLR